MSLTMQWDSLLLLSRLDYNSSITICGDSHYVAEIISFAYFEKYGRTEDNVVEVLLTRHDDEDTVDSSYVSNKRS